MKSAIALSASVVAVVLWGAGRPAQGSVLMVSSSGAQATKLDDKGQDKVVINDEKDKDPKDKDKRSKTKPPKDSVEDHDRGQGNDNKDQHDNGKGNDDKPGR
jgi:hypothetical protein